MAPATSNASTRPSDVPATISPEGCQAREVTDASDVPVLSLAMNELFTSPPDALLDANFFESKINT